MAVSPLHGCRSRGQHAPLERAFGSDSCSARTGFDGWQLACCILDQPAGRASSPDLCPESSEPLFPGEAFLSAHPSCLECNCFGVSQRDGTFEHKESRSEGQAWPCSSTEEFRSSCAAVLSEEAQVSQEAQGQSRFIPKDGCIGNDKTGNTVEDRAEFDRPFDGKPSSSFCCRDDTLSNCLDPHDQCPPSVSIEFHCEVPGGHRHLPPHDEALAKTDAFLNALLDAAPKVEDVKHRTLSYPKWCSEILGNVLKTRTPFAAFLCKTLRLSRLGRSSARPTPAFFPIPIPTMGVGARMTRSSSSVARHNRRLNRAVHTVVAALNFWHSGGSFDDMELLRRVPSDQHLCLYGRIRALIESDGAAEIGTIPSSGRRFNELVARLGDLSAFLTRHGIASSPYEKCFDGVPLDQQKEVEPDMQPYHDLCPAKIKLHGRANWGPGPYLSDELYMAFREPKSLLRNLPAPKGPLIRDTPEVAAELALKWDSLSLLQVHAEMIHADSPVRIFGAFKDPATHRQIGDRRGQNARECIVAGPGRDLPAAADFCELYCDAATSTLRISVTDRKDFYHQLAVSESKAIHNTIGPAIPRSLLEGTQAYSHFLLKESRKGYVRAKHGDHLRQEWDDPEFIGPGPGKIWASFRAILQGDRTGVEVATDAHTAMLQEAGLLDPFSRMVASRPLHDPFLAQGLVIDDYYAVSVEHRGSQPDQSTSAACLRKAKAAYDFHDLAGSPQKDVDAASEGRVIGGYLNASSKATSRGLVTLAAPVAKRLAISYLSLEVAKLPATSDALHLCMIGAWVSLLGFRRPLMSVLQQSFHLVDSTNFNRDHPKVIHLPRSVANELTLLAVLMPLAVTDLSVPFADEIFCTDASTKKGAILSAPVSPEISEVLWKTARSKGAYSRLLTPVESLLKKLDAFEELPHREESLNLERPLAYHYEFIEVFSGAAKISDFLAQWNIVVGPPLDLSESLEYDLGNVRVIEWLSFLVAEHRLTSFFLGPPCTTFSIMRRPRLRSRERPHGFDPADSQTTTGNLLACRSCQLMKVGSMNDAAGMLETPYSSYMKWLPAWQVIKSLPNTEEVRTDSCRFGSPHLKSFRLLGLNLDMESLALKCKCRSKHLQVEGTYTKKSATYTDELAKTIAAIFFKGIRRIQVAARKLDEVDTKGLECQLSNELMRTSPWKIESVWTFRKSSHINILEESVVLRLCQLIARRGVPKRVCALVDSNVVRCATSKGRSSSYGLSPVLRRVCATCVAAGIYISVPFTPTRLNCSDDPTRDVPLRKPSPGLQLETWTRAEVFKLASLPKTRRWASNWVRLIIRILGPAVLQLADRAMYRQTGSLFVGFFPGFWVMPEEFWWHFGIPRRRPSLWLFGPHFLFLHLVLHIGPRFAFQTLSFEFPNRVLLVSAVSHTSCSVVRLFRSSFCGSACCAAACWGCVSSHGHACYGINSWRDQTSCAQEV